MDAQIGLEERVIGHILMFTHGGHIEETPFLDDAVQDRKIFEKKDDPDAIDVRKRNPFADSNYYIAAREVLTRAIELGTYDVSEALIDVIVDPTGNGIPLNLFMSRVYDVHVGELFFYHKLGQALDIEKSVKPEIIRYKDVFKEKYEQLIADNPSTILYRQKAEVLLLFNKLIETEDKPVGTWNILDGDEAIIDILAHLSPEKLEEYADKYQDQTERYELLRNANNKKEYAKAIEIGENLISRLANEEVTLKPIDEFQLYFRMANLYMEKSNSPVSLVHVMKLYDRAKVIAETNDLKFSGLDTPCSHMVIKQIGKIVPSN